MKATKMENIVWIEDEEIQFTFKKFTNAGYVISVNMVQSELKLKIEEKEISLLND
jgi:hypothetical protein